MSKAPWIAATVIGCIGMAGCAHHPSTGAAGDGLVQSASQLAAYDQGVPSHGQIETVAQFDGPMPTGVTVSHQGRIFVNFPRWGDTVPFTVAELKNGKPVPFPDPEINRYDATAAAQHLVSVQSVVIDPADRLWMLDTGTINQGPTTPGGPKLVGVNLQNNKVFKAILFPPDVALSNSYLNDVRFDLKRGHDGMAYITDSANGGPNGIIVVDLNSGKSWRKLSDAASVKAEPNFVPVVEGRPLMLRPVAGVSKPLASGSDGIAISADGKTIYYRPLAGHHLYSVSTDLLLQSSLSEEQLTATVKDMGDLGYASDGLESDAAGNLYLTDYEHNAIHRRSPDGQDQIIAQGPRMIWPDTLSLATDGHLYFTANQLDRQKQFSEGKDLRQKPYYLFRIPVDAQPVLLKR